MKKYAKIVLISSLGLAGAAVAYVAAKKESLLNDALQHTAELYTPIENASDEEEN